MRPSRYGAVGSECGTRDGAGEDVEIRRLRGQASEAERVGEPTAEVRRLYHLLAARVIEARDLPDADGQTVPITEEALMPLPIGALQRMVREAIGFDARGNEAP
jgi:hypothetical protein